MEDTTTTTTTRVCIKNVPTSFDEKDLKKFLGKQKVTITDCKILRRSDGLSRKMAFVGFADETQAKYVVAHFHRTYCLTSRLIVEYAFAKNNNSEKNSNSSVRPWSKHSKGSSKYEKIHGSKDKEGEEKTTGKKEETIKMNDRKKEEFLAAMGISSTKTKRRIWENDDNMAAILMDESEKTSKNTSSLRDKEKKDITTKIDNNNNVTDDDDDESQSVASNDSSDSGGAGADALRSSSSTKSRPIGSVITDLDFLKSKSSNKDDLDSSDEDDSSSETEEEEAEKKDKKSTSSDDSDSSDSSSESSSDTKEASSLEEKDCVVNAAKEDEKDSKKEKKIEGKTFNDNDKKNQTATIEEAQDEDDNEEEGMITSANNRRLFVRNLPYSTTEEDLHELALTYGTVSECHIPVDDQKRNKGYAFLTFDSADAVARAKEELDGSDFQGRWIHVMPARNAKSPTEIDDKDLTYKQKQEILRKKESTATKSWSTNFVRADAVTDTLAERLGIRKGELFDVKGSLSSGDAAVRLALGETHIIEENRTYFQDNGIDMEALVSLKSSSKKRSKNLILVKNLPFDTVKDELAKLFGSVGVDDPERILLPPSKTIALIQYRHDSDAKRVFQKLAFKRYKHVPLYLEWAPYAAAEKKKEDNEEKVEEEEETPQETAVEEEEGENTVTSFSIYVKNLNFSTTEDRLRSCFENHDVTVRAAKIPTKAVAMNSSKTDDSSKLLSMGFGFVECDSEESVRKALSRLKGVTLDGHTLELKRSTKALTNTTTKKSKNLNPTKISCRNVPFQATRTDLLRLFGAFGTLKKIRLPKKYDGGHRGFAFAEYARTQEAVAAMNALSRSTHLYGRRLVLEWAEVEDTTHEVGTLREKAKRDLGKIDIMGQSSTLNKKTKFN